MFGISNPVEKRWKEPSGNGNFQCKMETGLSLRERVWGAEEEGD